MADMVARASGSKSERQAGAGVAFKYASNLLQSLLHCADGKAGDKAVEEKIVKNGYGQAGDETGGHERSPKINVAPNKEDRNPYAHHLICLRRNKSQCVNELLRHQSER